MDINVIEACAPSLVRADSPARIRPAELAGLLDRFRGVEELSLDCFDTVVWRYVEKPVDVFHVAARRPAFRAHGFDARLRVAAERTARALQQLRAGQSEVGLGQIYRAERPGLSDEQVHELAEDELAAEMQSCFAHPAAVELLRSARRRKVPVAIVSDTYFDEQRLRRLLMHVLPADAADAIRRIACSSDYGVSKVQGLLERAHRSEGVDRGALLHVGDNRVADYDAAVAAGMQAAHLVQYDDQVVARERMRGVALSVLEPKIRDTQPMCAPYRAAEAASSKCDDDDTGGLGESAFGPVMHAFAHWIAEERRALCERRGHVKLLFLLRDGHLPYLAHRALDPAPECHRVSISRFTAFAASFRDLADIDRYLAQFGKTRRFDILARQLLLSRGLAAQIIGQANRAADPVTAFCEAVRRPEVVASITEASSRFRCRMWRYLEREAGLQRGDTVVFVDLGYSGTAQRLLQPIFKQEWNVDVLGRYLLLSGMPDDDRRGLIDNSWCDRRAIDALVPYVSLIENLCAGAIGSVEDYTEDGGAVLAEQLIDTAQSRRVDQLQQRCVGFVRNAEAFFGACMHPVRSEWLRDAALAEFARLVFFPTRAELGALSDFQLDLNLGSKDRMRLFDCDAGLDGLRQRGVNFIEQNAMMRLQHPAELRAAGLELSMTLLAQHRFGLDIPLADWSYRSEEIEVLLLRGDESARNTAQAHATHDGYFAAVLPMGSGDFHLGLLLGLAYSWIQVHSVEIVPMKELMSETESLYRRDIRSSVVLDGICDHGQGLWECSNEASLAMIPGGVAAAAGPHACRFVFRPIARRVQG